MDVIAKQFGKCPHLNDNRQCQFQINGQPELMPVICRVYPRDAVKCDVETEVTMELSCISMAKVFLEHPGRLSFIPTQEKIASTWEMDNNDPDFYRFLKEDREKILDYIWNEENDLSEIWQVLYAFVYRQHDLIVGDKIEEAKQITISDDPVDMGMYYLDRDYTYAFFSLKTIDRMILEHINYGNLKMRERSFFKLILGYRRIFSDFTVKEADDFFNDNVRKMMNEGYGEKYRSYFSYCTQELFIKAYESYHILRQFLFSVLYVQLLMVFDLVDYIKSKNNIASLDRQSEILMLCEQGIRHNPSLTKNLMAVIREEFL